MTQCGPFTESIVEACAVGLRFNPGGARRERSCVAIRTPFSSSAARPSHGALVGLPRREGTGLDSTKTSLASPTTRRSGA